MTVLRNKYIALALQVCHLARGDIATIILQLTAQIVQQLLASHAIGTAWVIVGDRDEIEPAAAFVNHDDVAPEAFEVHSRREATRPAANDQSVVNGSSHLPIVNCGG